MRSRLFIFIAQNTTLRQSTAGNTFSLYFFSFLFSWLPHCSSFLLLFFFLLLLYPFNHPMHFLICLSENKKASAILSCHMSCHVLHVECCSSPLSKPDPTTRFVECWKWRRSDLQTWNLATASLSSLQYFAAIAVKVCTVFDFPEGSRRSEVHFGLFSNTCKVLLYRYVA